MNKQIYVNLPVADLEKSRAFFGALGYDFNPQFSDENAACMIISDTIYAMLLAREYFQTFTSKNIVDAHQGVEVLIALNMDSREAVDDMIEKVLAAGGTEAGDPKDYGFMYYRAYNDLDGHTWEIMWMDPSAMNK